MIIKAESICRTYVAGEIETRALDRVSFEVAAGEFLAVTGPSGCGKSTLLNVLGLLDAPTEGRYWLFGEEVSGCSERQLMSLRRRGIGFIFQSFHLIADLTVEENVALPLVYRSMSRAERSRLTAATLDRMGILHRRNHLPHQLSGGQQQRVAIARAIVCNPTIVLADEPTGNLDSQNGKEVMRVLGELAATGTTVVMVTHFEAHAQHAGRVVQLVDGRIVRDSAKAA